jgi:cytochrome c
MFAYRRMFVIAAAFMAPAVFAAEAKPDIENGKTQFMIVCSICHSATKEPGGALLGPSLFGVMGRKAAGEKSFTNYTDALKKYSVTWNAKTLDVFLENPAGVVESTNMIMPVPDAKNRADIIAYLATLE